MCPLIILKRFGHRYLENRKPHESEIWHDKVLDGIHTNDLNSFAASQIHRLQDAAKGCTESGAQPYGAKFQCVESTAAKEFNAMGLPTVTSLGNLAQMTLRSTAAKPKQKYLVENWVKENKIMNLSTRRPVKSG